MTLNPSVLVLDEPTANLDPKQANEILQVLMTLHKKRKISILVVEHRLDLIAQYASRLILLNKGKILIDDTPLNAFQNPIITSLGVSIPRITKLFKHLGSDGYNINQLPLEAQSALELLFPGGSPKQ